MFGSLRLWQKEGRERQIKAAKDAKRHAAKSDAQNVQEYDRQNVEQGWVQIDRRHQLDIDKVYVAQQHPKQKKQDPEKDPLMQDMMDRPPTYTPAMYPALPMMPHRADPVVPPFPISTTSGTPPPTEYQRPPASAPDPLNPSTPASGPHTTPLTDSPCPVTPPKERSKRGYPITEKGQIETMLHKWVLTSAGIEHIWATIDTFETIDQINMVERMCEILMEKWEENLDDQPPKDLLNLKQTVHLRYTQGNDLRACVAKILRHRKNYFHKLNQGTPKSGAKGMHPLREVPPPGFRLCQLRAPIQR
ncbi:hypothetical protein NDU88_008085 [Pleurodeles waltl]|uniref:Uncharacterized protein n=1 Tax=Pleurodeles waltl TaxID=8319 RepID=A0AAV7PPD9_PLEWA|nr:hypothetical protein NDU88_008085 [Pleurodeles waltl]